MSLHCLVPWLQGFQIPLSWGGRLWSRFRSQSVPSTVCLLRLAVQSWQVWGLQTLLIQALWSLPSASAHLPDTRTRSHRVTSALLEARPQSSQTKPWTACCSGRLGGKMEQGCETVRRTKGTWPPLMWRLARSLSLLECLQGIQYDHSKRGVWKMLF